MKSTTENLKILYIYDYMPDVYQNYMNILLQEIQRRLNVKTLAYIKDKRSDFVVNSYGFFDKIQRVFFKIKVSKSNSMDIKIMKNFDIIHLQHSYMYRKLFPLLVDKNIKTVITLRGGDTYIKPWLYNAWRDFYLNEGQNIDAFITMSENQKKYLTRWGINENKIHVIPISFGTHALSKPKYPNKDILKLVSAYRMTWEKNIEGTIKFAKSLKDNNITFEYDIYGDGNDLGQLYYLVDKYNLTDCVNIKGKIDNEVLKSKLKNYDFFVQISSSEALSSSVIEAQSQGVPCVVSNSDGLPEAVINDKTAIVEDYSKIELMVDRCLNLWKNSELYYSFSEKAIENANDNFSVEKEAERLTTLYKSL